jgi:hypothetical protein
MKNNTLLDKLSVMLVSVYLVIVAFWLIVTRKLPSPHFGRIALAYTRKPYSLEIHELRAESGHCWLGSLPGYLLSDKESSSLLVLFENDVPLGPAHAGHDDIRNLGGGRFSHWGTELYFSTSDNSDPRSNGKRYTVREIR